jgi:hypothetical protein
LFLLFCLFNIMIFFSRGDSLARVELNCRQYFLMYLGLDYDI